MCVFCTARVLWLILGQGSICDGGRNSSMDTVLFLKFREKDPVVPGVTAVAQLPVNNYSMCFVSFISLTGAAQMEL